MFTLYYSVYPVQPFFFLSSILKVLQFEECKASNRLNEVGKGYPARCLLSQACCADVTVV